MDETQPMCEVKLPIYQCHKKVKGFKIVKIEASLNGSKGVYLIKGKEVMVTVSYDYVLKHKPDIGGYYIRHKGGYEAWSPAEVFENGYSLINPLANQSTKQSK